MPDLQIAPLLAQILEHQPPMAVLGRRLAAQKRRGRSEHRSVQVLFNFPFRHELEEAIFVIGPRAFALLECLQHFLSGRKQGLVPVFRVANCTHEEGEVIPLGEARQLRYVVQTDVQQTPDAGALQKSEELLCRFFRETDGIDFHAGTVSYSNSASWLSVFSAASSAASSC